MIPRGRLRRFPFCSRVQVTYAEAWKNWNAATEQVAIASGIPRRLFAIDPAEFMVEAVLTSPPGLTEPELIIWDNVDEAKRRCGDFFTVKGDREPCGGHSKRSLIEAGWDKNILMGGSDD